MPLKIAVYMIVNGEVERANKALASAQDADEIFVFDTGLSNLERDELLRNGLEWCYNKINVKPWRFDVARNTALSLILIDVDICVALDADEVLADGWRQEIERVWVPGETTVLRYMYDWSQGMVFPQAKIHAREGYHWVYAAHERLHYYTVGKKEVFANTDKFLIYHHPDLTKPRGNYLPLLHMTHIEYPTHKQVMFYYGRELWKAGANEHAAKMLEKYLLACGEEENAETAYACRILGQLTDLDTWFTLGIDHMPTHREPYIWYADWLYKKGRYQEAMDTYVKAIEIVDRTTDYTVESRCWDGYPSHCIAWCSYHLKHMDATIAAASIALDMEPDNEDYKNALKKFQEEAGRLANEGSSTSQEDTTT